MNIQHIIFYICILSTFSACTTLSEKGERTRIVFSPVTFDSVSSFSSDDLDRGLATFAKSCVSIAKGNPESYVGNEPVWGTFHQWQSICNELHAIGPLGKVEAQKFIYHNFNVFSIGDGKSDTGLLTGYYEPSLAAAPHADTIYTIPIRARPDDLVTVNLGDFLPELKGKRIAGRVSNNMLKPYEDRAAIENNQLPSTADKPLFWAKDPVDVFFLQVQGSGILVMPDGTNIRVCYDGQNGHPYTAIGKELVKRGALPANNVTMQSIREWLAAHPDEGRSVMQTNKSYVFFKKLEGDGPLGAEGVPLTAERSLAVDSKYIPYGVPLFITSDNPSFARLMVAQDTGGAIQGILRGDVFWGNENGAAEIAGSMKAKGHFWVLIPKSVGQQEIKQGQ